MVEVLYELPLIGRAAIVLRPSWAYISRKDERGRRGGRGEGGKDVIAKSQSLFSRMVKSF